MTKEEFKQSLIKNGYPKPLAEAAFEYSKSINLQSDRLVGTDKEMAEMIEGVAMAGFLEGFGFCAKNIAHKLDLKEES